MTIVAIPNRPFNGVSSLVKRARTRSSAAKISFFALLIILFTAVFGVAQETYKPSSVSTEFDQESLAVDEAQAEALASRIEDSVSKGEVKQLQPLYDGDRFMKKVLRGHDATLPHLRDMALGASDAFKQGKLLETVALFTREGAEFTFIKFYRKGQEPILQFRLIEELGNLHYMDFYIFKAANGDIKVDDLHYYNSGEPMSKIVIGNATDLSSRSSSSSTDLKTLQKALQLSYEGKVEEGFTVLETLPEAVKQNRAIMRLRIQWGYQIGAGQSEKLFDEFKNKFPDDQSIIFSAFTAAIAKDDAGRAAALIEDIYKAINGDEYLLWYRVNLISWQKKYQEATRLLSEMESKYKIDVVSDAKSELTEEFLSSREYKSWLSKRRKK